MKSIAVATDPDAVFLTVGFALVMLTAFVARLAALLEAMTKLVLAWTLLREALDELRHQGRPR